MELIRPNELKDRLDSKDNELLLVDIRDESEYDDWNIKGSLNVPVNKYLATGEVDKIKKAFSSLPKEKDIITVCARGINSQVASEILNEMGYVTHPLEKGMKGWNENFVVYVIDFEKFKVVQFVRIGKGCLSYIVHSKKKKSAVVIDASIFTHEYINFANENSLNLKYVFDTHSHADHFSGGMSLASELGIDYYINKTDVDDNFEFKSLDSISEMNLDDVKIIIVKTPGHTDGSLSFLIDDKALICGDLLLLESVGRPDLAREKEETIRGAENLYSTVQNFILRLSDDVCIFPAHFTRTEIRPVTLTLKELKDYNDSITISDRSEFIKFITENIPVTPPNYQSIKKFNKSGTKMPLDYAEDLEIGPNRCAAR
jgi:glyoxylase-like metal-dependent hydrolase (beta-lactamase superfamily II)